MEGSNKSCSQSWVMYHIEPVKIPPEKEIIEEFIIQWDRGKSKLKLPFPFSDFEFEAYAYFVEPREKRKKMLKSKDTWEYTSLEFRIVISEKQFNLLAGSLGGKYIEHLG